MKRELLRMNHVSLIKNGEKLLDNLNFQMYAGEIMGLIGKNGRAEEEYVDLICYNHPISFGTVWYDGRIVNSYSHSDNSENRVCVIESKSSLVEGLSVVDNLFVLRKGFKKYFINEKVLWEQARQFLGENGIRVDIGKRVDSLSPLERCLVELGKALLAGCRLVIVDNPGNFLSQYELTEFQRMLKKIRDGGISILYIGNHHQEIFRVADRTSLYSGGYIEKVFEKDELTDEAIAPYITEWSLKETDPDPESEEGVMHFHSVYAGSLKGLKFVLHKGECLTLLDMDNRIARDILGLLTGRIACERGRITLEHEPYAQKKAAHSLDAGIGVIPQDGVERLLFWDRTYMENLTFLLDRKLKKSVLPARLYRSVRKEYGPFVGPAIDETNIANLKLHEQIALLYYRLQLLHPRVLVCVQPLAKGDLFTRRRTLELIQETLSQGTAVLIITANISDTLEISDRFLVVEEGVCTAAYEKEEFGRIVW